MRLLIAAVVAVAASHSAGAETVSKAKATIELGSIFGSEKICGLSLNQDAITAWIAANVSPEEMGFADSLNGAATFQAHLYSEQSTTARAAHCAAITRTAKHYGFIE